MESALPDFKDNLFSFQFPICSPAYWNFNLLVLDKDTPLAKRLRQLRDQMVLEASRGKRSPAGEK
jgi:hypothetical protein